MQTSAINHSTSASSLGEILEKILDKGVVIAGDISIAIADVELLTIKIRLVVASIDKAKEMGIDWWESDPNLSSKARKKLQEENEEKEKEELRKKQLEDQNKQLLERLERLEAVNNKDNSAIKNSYYKRK
jgi:hypothetical protein